MKKYYRLVYMFALVACLFSCGGGNSTENIDADEIMEPPPLSVERIYYQTPFDVIEPSIRVHQGYIYVTDGINNVRVFEFSNRKLNEVTRVKDEIHGASKSHQTLIIDNTLYVKKIMGYPGEIEVFNISDPTQLISITTIPESPGVGAIAHFDHFLYSGGSLNDNLKIFDISDSTNISLIKEVEVDGPVQDIVIKDMTLFAISQQNIVIFDIVEGGGDLAYNSTFYMELSEYQMVENDNKLYGARSRHLQVVDISTPSSPVTMYIAPEDTENRLVSPVLFAKGVVFVGGRNKVLVYQEVEGSFQQIFSFEASNEVVALAVFKNNLVVINASKPVVAFTGLDGGPSSIEVFDISAFN